MPIALCVSCTILPKLQCQIARFSTHGVGEMGKKRASLSTCPLCRIFMALLCKYCYYIFNSTPQKPSIKNTNIPNAINVAPIYEVLGTLI